jgi:hypothetical protein
VEKLKSFEATSVAESLADLEGFIAKRRTEIALK